jgi:hypothetical protein
LKAFTVNLNRRCLFIAVALSVVLGVDTAIAQNTRPADPAADNREQDSPASQPDDSPKESRGAARWEFEAHGGWSAIRTPDQGSVSLPTTGAIVGGLIGISSFYLGEGASLFNQNQLATTGGPAVVPLDSVLVGPSLRERSAGAFGIRIGRTLNPRLSIEATADVSVVRVSFMPAAVTAIEATRASRTPALERALASSPVAAAVTSVATVADRQLASHLFATGTLIVNLRETGKAIPYLAIGAGAVFNEGATPGATLVGTYRLGDPVHIVGTDTVTLRYALNGPTLVGIAGGGVKYLVTPRWGVRLDARAQLYSDASVTVLDVTPATTLESTGARFPIVTSGALQFSSTAPLTGPALAGAITYSGTGLQTHVVVAAGFFFRF